MDMTYTEIGGIPLSVDQGGRLSELFQDFLAEGVNNPMELAADQLLRE